MIVSRGKRDWQMVWLIQFGKSIKNWKRAHSQFNSEEEVRGKNWTSSKKGGRELLDCWNLSSWVQIYCTQSQWESPIDTVGVSAQNGGDIPKEAVLERLDMTLISELDFIADARFFGRLEVRQRTALLWVTHNSLHQTLTGLMRVRGGHTATNNKSSTCYEKNLKDMRN